MLLSKQDEIKLNVLAHGAGAEAIEYLAERMWAYYTHELAFTDTDKDKNAGAAQLADWLKKLPKGLQDGRHDPARG